MIQFSHCTSSYLSFRLAVRPPVGPVQSHPQEVPAGRHQGLWPLHERHRGGHGEGGTRLHLLRQGGASRARDLPAHRLPGRECDPRWPAGGAGRSPEPMVAVLLPSKVSPLNERLREFPNAKMLMDVVQVNGGHGAPELRKVLQFVCGNTLVCDTIGEARSMAFGRQERHKVTRLRPPPPQPPTTNQSLMLSEHFPLFSLPVCLNCCSVI